ncbi:hypothetical protein AADZ84_11845 [Colwelliaceae bacterium MEBiC 14330]
MSDYLNNRALIAIARNDNFDISEVDEHLKNSCAEHHDLTP